MKLKELVHGFHNTTPDSEQILNRLKTIRDTIGGVTPTEASVSVPKAGSNFYGAIQELDETIVTHSRIAKEIHGVVGQIVQSVGSGYPVRPATAATCAMPPADPETEWQDGPHINFIDIRSAFGRINSDLMDSRDVVDHVLDFLAGSRIAGGTDSKREQSDGILGEMGAAYSEHCDILEDYSQLLDQVELALGEGYFLTEEPQKLPSAIELAKQSGIKAAIEKIKAGGAHTVGSFNEARGDGNHRD